MPSLTKYEVSSVKNGRTEIKEYLFADDKMGKRYGMNMVSGKHEYSHVEVTSPQGVVLFTYDKEAKKS